jgi:DNA-binding transcriptional LysR family regulator
MNQAMRFEDVPDLNAKQLLAIVTIAEYGSFTTAASVLDMSQPALSRILQRVEQVLGIKLFARSTRKLEITPAGRKALARAEQALDGLEGDVLDGLSPDERATLRELLARALAERPGDRFATALLQDYQRDGRTDTPSFLSQRVLVESPRSNSTSTMGMARQLRHGVS